MVIDKWSREQAAVVRAATKGRNRGEEAMRKIHFLLILSVCVFVGGVTGEDDLVLGDECEYQEDCDHIANAICNSADECDCDYNYVAASNKSTCLPLATKPGHHCEIAEQCKNVPRAECVSHTCTVTEVTNVDVPTTTVRAKDECTKDSECSSFLIKRVCKNGTCVLDLPPASPRAILDAFVLNQACANDSECSAEGTACIDKACKCKDNFVPSLNLKSCLQKAKSVGDKCVENVQCLLLNGSVCEGGKCTEKITKFFNNFSDKIPQLLIGSSCQTNDDCKHLTHAECRESVCQCTDNFITSVSSNSCLEKAKKEGDPCKIDKQCEDIKEATCIQDKCVKPGVVGTKLGKQNGGSRTQTVSQLILAAILFIKMFSV